MALEVTALIAEIVRRLMDCASVDEAEDAAVIEATHPGGVLQRVVDDATVAGVRRFVVGMEPLRSVARRRS